MMALILAGACANASAQAYPAKPIRLVVGFAPGGAADFVARAIGEPLGRALGQSIVIENRAGAGSSIAADYVAKSAPDGYTMLIASPSSISVNPALNPKLGYSLRDLAPITKVSTSPLLIAVNPGIGVSSIRELIAAAKKAPGGSITLPPATARRRTWPACCSPASPASTWCTSRSRAADRRCNRCSPATPRSRSRHRPRCCRWCRPGACARSRSPAARARRWCPTCRAWRKPASPDYEMSFWYGFFVPAGTKPEIVKKLFDATISALQQPEVKQAFAREATETAASRSPEEFAAFLAEDAKFWVRLVKESGAKLD